MQAEKEVCILFNLKLSFLVVAVVSLWQVQGIAHIYAYLWQIFHLIRTFACCSFL